MRSPCEAGRRQQQRGRRAARHRRRGRGARGRRLARRAGRDRRQLPHPRRDGALGGPPRRGRDDEPDPPRRLPPRHRRGDGVAGQGPYEQLPDRRLHGRGRAGRPGGDRARGGLPCSTTSGAAVPSPRRVRLPAEPVVRDRVAPGSTSGRSCDICRRPAGGVVVVRRALVDRLRHPAPRALRVDSSAGRICGDARLPATADLAAGAARRYAGSATAREMERSTRTRRGRRRPGRATAEVSTRRARSVRGPADGRLPSRRSSSRTPPLRRPARRALSPPRATGAGEFTRMLSARPPRLSPPTIGAGFPRRGDESTSMWPDASAPGGTDPPAEPGRCRSAPSFTRIRSRTPASRWRRRRLASSPRTTSSPAPFLPAGPRAARAIARLQDGRPAARPAVASGPSSSGAHRGWQRGHRVAAHRCASRRRRPRLATPLADAALPAPRSTASP